VWPLEAASLSGLPAALIQVAEDDLIRDDGAEYAQRLVAEGYVAQGSVLLCSGVVNAGKEVRGLYVACRPRSSLVTGDSVIRGDGTNICIAFSPPKGAFLVHSLCHARSWISGLEKVHCHLPAALIVVAGDYLIGTMALSMLIACRMSSDDSLSFIGYRIEVHFKEFPTEHVRFLISPTELGAISAVAYQMIGDFVKQRSSESALLNP
jgi:hypothetical protein